MERVRALLTREKPVKWLFWGDSITQGAIYTWGGRDYTQLFGERVRVEMGRGLDIVLNTAISAHTTRDLLREFDWRVTQFSPDAVFLMIGMNDCADKHAMSPEEFGGNLHRLADRIEEADGLCILQTTCPILPGTAPDREPRFPLFMETIREIATARELPLIDHYAHWRPEVRFSWMDNAFHPNASGHVAFAHYLFEQVGVFSRDSAICRLFKP